LRPGDAVRRGRDGAETSHPDPFLPRPDGCADIDSGLDGRPGGAPDRLTAVMAESQQAASALLHRPEIILGFGVPRRPVDGIRRGLEGSVVACGDELAPRPKNGVQAA